MARKLGGPAARLYSSRLVEAVPDVALPKLGRGRSRVSSTGVEGRSLVGPSRALDPRRHARTAERRCSASERERARRAQRRAADCTRRRSRGCPRSRAQLVLVAACRDQDQLDAAARGGRGCRRADPSGRAPRATRRTQTFAAGLRDRSAGWSPDCSTRRCSRAAFERLGSRPSSLPELGNGACRSCLDARAGCTECPRRRPRPAHARARQACVPVRAAALLAASLSPIATACSVLKAAIRAAVLAPAPSTRAPLPRRREVRDLFGPDECRAPLPGSPVCDRLSACTQAPTGRNRCMLRDRSHCGYP